ncbi:putative alanine racemase 2 [Leptomonas pyrrhocoris]|uniref:Putative alanine racemase 2 n=1 Tax=Leptomonas pyrrhocoris TaxID=157538 RepID=A0A0M9GAH3_LEPPY|nr:putative alanine racemase 2 [Leptomonas pyrrhocoris]KPA86036.1 putative alanine racemase 2 [Leptomonas pyrrhocoris]|eukprot:XP_015664475.1 putative alanine racemase 2 [Leptomonas pyrrhocoris]
MLRCSTFLEVRLPHIAHNIDLIRTHYASKATLIPMIKGNAYGNGLERVAGYIHDACRVNHFGVASLGEAVAVLKGNAHSIDTGRTNHVVVFSDTELMDESVHHVYAEQNAKYRAGNGAQLAPVLGTEEQLQLFCKLRRTIFKDTPLCLKINTGMDRLGVTLERLKELTPLLRENGGVDLLLQHFSVSGLVGHSFTKAQHIKFQQAKESLQAAGVEVRGTSAANSGAIEQRLAVEEMYVRPGLMLYGPTSLAASSITPDEVPKYRLWDGKCCGYFYTKVLHHYVAKAGSYIGYGITHNLVPEDAVIVLIPVGYADGFMRYYSNMPVTVSPAPPRGHEDDPAVKESALVGVVHGNVNMDIAAVAVHPAMVGHSVEEIMRRIENESQILVWGNDVAEKAAAVKSIPYQLMCGLSIRVPRRYVE